MDITKIFESIMLICFGMAWPLSIMKTWRTKVSAGKSVPFLCVIMTGYLSGIMFKITGKCDAVIALYILNFVMVAVDLALVLKYRNNKVQS